MKTQHAEEAARRAYKKSKALAVKAGRGIGTAAARAWWVLAYPACWTWRTWYALKPNEKFEVLIQGAILILAAVGASFAYCQLGLMRETMEAAERAWVLPVAKGIGLDRGHHAGCPINIGRVIVPLQNFGKGPAFDITSGDFVYLGTGYPEKARRVPVQRPAPDSYLLPPGGNYIAEADTCFTMWDPDGRPNVRRARALFKAAFRVSGGVRIQSRVSYRDQFGKERHTLTYVRVKRSRGGAFSVTLEGQGQHAD